MREERAEVRHINTEELMNNINKKNRTVKVLT